MRRIKRLTPEATESLLVYAFTNGKMSLLSQYIKMLFAYHLKTEWQKLGLIHF